MSTTFDMHVDPIVSRDEIQRLAREAAEQGVSVHDSNPYIEGSQAHVQFQRDYWARDLQLRGDEVT